MKVIEWIKKDPSNSSKDNQVSQFFKYVWHLLISPRHTINVLSNAQLAFSHQSPNIIDFEVKLYYENIPPIKILIK